MITPEFASTLVFGLAMMLIGVVVTVYVAEQSDQRNGRILQTLANHFGVNIVELPNGDIQVNHIPTNTVLEVQSAEHVQVADSVTLVVPSPVTKSRVLERITAALSGSAHGTSSASANLTVRPTVSRRPWWRFWR